MSMASRVGLGQKIHFTNFGEKIRRETFERGNVKRETSLKFDVKRET